jgi:hypothetical protein
MQRLRFINAAMNEAIKSDMTYKIGAVAVRGGKVIASAFNTDAKTIIMGSEVRTHAECNLLNRLSHIQRRKKWCFLRGHICCQSCPWGNHINGATLCALHNTHEAVQD